MDTNYICIHNAFTFIVAVELCVECDVQGEAACSTFTINLSMTQELNQKVHLIMMTTLLGKATVRRELL